MEQIELLDQTELQLAQKEPVSYAEHQFVRLNTINSRSLKTPRVIDFETDLSHYRLTSRVSIVHLSLMELAIRLAGTKNIVEMDDGSVMAFFDLKQLIKSYGMKTNERFVVDKFKELGGFIDENGDIQGSYIESWSKENSLSVNRDSFFASSSGGIIESSGFADRKDRFFLEKEGTLDYRASNLGYSEDSLETKMSNRFYFYIKFSATWFDFLRESKLLKIATLRGLTIISSIKDSRLQSIVRHMCGHKAGVSRSLEGLISTLELSEGVSSASWRTSKKRIIDAALKEEAKLTELGIEWNPNNFSFKRFSNDHISVIKNSE